MKQKKVIVVGSIIRDMFLQIDELTSVSFKIGTDQQLFFAIPEGRKIELQDICFTLGGGGANSATLFARRGYEVELCGAVGTDALGTELIKEINQNGISSTYVTQVPEHTGISCIFPGVKGNRAILVYRGANHFFSSDTIPKELFKSCALLYLAPFSKDACSQLPVLCALANKFNVPIYANPSSIQIAEHCDSLLDALSHIDILQFNVAEAKSFLKMIKSRDLIVSDERVEAPALLRSRSTRYSEMSGDWLQDFFRAVLTHGPRLIIVTNGAEGVYVCDGKTIYFQKSIPCTVVSTVGAGDAFGATFAAVYFETESVEEALCAAVTQSALVVGQCDAQAGLCTTKELEKQIKTLATEKVVRYTLESIHKNAKKG